jgi:hypothetical protein
VSRDLRLRFVVKRHAAPATAGGLKARKRGRPKNFKPLLVAIDAICRLGAGKARRGEEGFFRTASLRRGPRGKNELTSKRDALIEALAHDWELTFETVWDYLHDQERFYYVPALGLVEALIQLPMRPRLTLTDIGRAVAQHRPGNEHLRLVPLQGLEFNLLPFVDRPQQPSTRAAIRAARNPAMD